MTIDRLQHFRNLFRLRLQEELADAAPDGMPNPMRAFDRAATGIAITSERLFTVYAFGRPRPLVEAKPLSEAMEHAEAHLARLDGAADTAVTIRRVG